MFGLSIKEIAIIILIGVILFGYKKLPEVAKAIGSSILSFRKEIKDVEKNIKRD